MRIDEVTRGLHQYIARVRVSGAVCDVGIESGSIQQARTLLAKSYGSSSVISCVAVLDESETSSKPESPKPKVIKPLKPIKPKSGVIKSIKPLTAKQGIKRAAADLKKSIKYNERKTKAQLQVRKSQNKLADLNRTPPVT